MQGQKPLLTPTTYAIIVAKLQNIIYIMNTSFKSSAIWARVQQKCFFVKFFFCC